ncbi:MAG: flagellar protein FlaG [Candidatus Sulfopaludibacter sp.]|nr:flagellar protein FlaG [Candidatus Sulfopaludibacter sp.]
MDITAASNSRSAPSASIPEIHAEQGPQNRSIVRAIKALNETESVGPGNYLTFQRDPSSKRMVIQLVNRETHDIVAQIPPEYVMRLAEDLKQPQAESTPNGTG